MRGLVFFRSKKVAEDTSVGTSSSGIDEDEKNIEELISSNTPLTQQILLLNSQVQSKDDGSYALDDLLKNDVIKIDQYLRLVREFSREQFFQKAHLKVCLGESGVLGSM